MRDEENQQNQAINLLNNEQRFSKVNSHRNLLPRPQRRSHEDSPHFQYAQLQSPLVQRGISPKHQKRNSRFSRFTESILEKTQRSSAIIGYLLFMVMLICLMAQIGLMTLIFKKNWILLQRVQAIVLGQLIAYAILLYTKVEPIVSFLDIINRFKAGRKYGLKAYKQNRKNGILEESNPLSQSRQKITKAWKFFVLAFLSICYSLIFALSLNGQFQMPRLIYSITILPLVFFRLRVQSTGHRKYNFVYGLIGISILLSHSWQLILFCIVAFWLQDWIRFDNVLIAFTFYTRFVLFLVIFIYGLISSFDLEGNAKIIGISIFIALAILLTRHIGDKIIRKELYRHFFADFHMDCAYCVIPLILLFSNMGFQQDILVFIGCILLFFICYKFRADNYLEQQGVNPMHE